MPELILPYPPSANRYWRHNRGIIHRSPEANAYKREIWALARSNGISDPTTAPVSLALILRPIQPKDWHRRQKADPNGYTVRCIDLDNAQKVALDALQGIAYVNDNQVVSIQLNRGLPIEGGVLEISWGVMA